MASGRIKGITIEIAGDTKKLSQSLNDVDTSLRNTQAKLKDVNKLLKLDPKNTELLKQKQELLNKSIEQSKDKVKQLDAALDSMGGRTEKNAESYDAIQREIIECQQQQKKWNDELDAMTPKVASLQDKLQGISDATGKASEATKGLSMAAGGAAVGMVAMATKAAASADDLMTLANQTGFTVEELQKMQYASDFVDVSMESMTGSITKLTKNMASGSKVFDTLGVSITDANGNMRDATDVWYESLEALGKVTNETERDQLSMELFGKSAMEMAGIVDDGGAALKQLGDEAESTGLILGRDAVADAVAFNDQMDKMKNTATQALFKAGSTLSTTLVPAFTKLVDVVSQLLSWFGNLDGTTQTLILALLALVAAISPVLGLVSTLTALAAGLNVAMLPMLGTIAAVIAIIGVLVAAGVVLYKNWDTVKAKVTQLWNAIKSAFDNIRNAISTAVNNAQTAATNAFNRILSTVSSVVNSIKNAVSSAFNSVVSAVSSAVNSVYSAVSSAFNSVVSTISSAVNSAYSVVTSVFGSISGFISGAIGGITGTVSSVFWDVYNTISGAINSARDVVTSAVNTIKSAFNFSWSLPHLRVPHVSVSGGVAPYGIGGKGSLPHFNVTWYKKAYENAVLFSRPTVLPTFGGMKGFGDGAGSEMVIGTDKLREIVGASRSNDIDINIYAQPGMNETAIANAVAVKLDRWFGERL